MNASTYAGPLLVTVAYLTTYYASMLHILRTKTRLLAEYRARGERFDRYYGQDREMLAADRIQLNTLEHMPPFLVLLWLNAVFVSPFFATVVGCVYLGARLIYPFLMGRKVGSAVRIQIIFATAPGYGVMAVYGGALVWAALGG